MRVAFDIETNGLLPDVNKLHSLVLKDLDTGDVWSASSQDPHDLKLAVKELAAADYRTGHNILSYDSPVIQHLVPGTVFRNTSRDTLIMAKMIWPVDKLKELDFPRWRSGKLPGHMIGAHRLEAWGYRMGQMKGEYSGDVKKLSKELLEHQDLSRIPEWAHCLLTRNDKGQMVLDPWLSWNQPMQDYCVQDVEVTHTLWELIQGHFDGTGKAAHGVAWSERCIDLEHRVWQHIDQEQARGYGFDKAEAVKMAGGLKTRQAELEDELVKVFGSWWQPGEVTKPSTRNVKRNDLPHITQRRISERTGKELAPYVGPPLERYSEDAPFTPITRIKFNPKSRQHLGDRLQDVFGWKPVEFGGKDGDQAKVDETTIKGIPESVLPKDLKETILEFLVNAKTLGQLADGKKSWIDLCKDDGRIHGRMDTLGTVSHRGAHMDPNKGQVPSVKKEKDEHGVEHPILGWKGGYGAESRTLWRPGNPGWWQTGVDASGLELRLLGHYLQPFDGGLFADRVSTPGLDIHAENAKVTGLSRADTKTVTYAFLYGAGPLLIGLGVGVPEDQIEALGTSPQAKNYVSFMKRIMKSKFIQPDIQTLAHVVKGQQVQKAFLEGIAGLKDLKKDVTEMATAQGYIVAIDGRKLHIRKPHAAVNQLLQGGGSVVCKEWMMETDRILQEHYGITRDVDFGQMAWVHDELQFEHREEAYGQYIQEASQKAIENVAISLDFRGKLATDGRTGRNWKDCH